MSEHKVSWGKILVGAAIAAGAVTAFVFAEPYIQATVVPALKELGTQIGSALASAWAWVGTHVIGSADVGAIKEASTATSEFQVINTATQSSNSAIADLAKNLLPAAKDKMDVLVKGASEATHGLVGLAMQNKPLAIGTAAIAGGLLASGSVSTGMHHHQPSARNLEDESFAMREDIRRMQALMAARMAATGYQPAMAMAGQGRG